MPKLKTPRVLDAKTVLEESEIYRSGPNQEPGVDLIWRPSSDDPPLPNTRLRGYRAAKSASIYFQPDGDEWNFYVCGFIGHSSEKKDSCPTYQEALETAVTELSDRINQAWQSEFPQQLERQKRQDAAEEALNAAREMQRDASHKIENEESNDNRGEG